jgi:hypothetical protein
MKGNSSKRKKQKMLPKRNIAAKLARDQKAGAMKDKRRGKGGARDTFRLDLREME